MTPLIGSWTGLLGHKNPRDAILDSVASDLAKDPRVTVVQVDRDGGQVIVNVKATNKTLTFALTKVEAKTLSDGQAGQEWVFEWKDQDGKVLALGHGSGSPSKSIHVDVPGVP